jgi:hypothetical protein
MLSDTAPDIQARMYEAYRHMSPSRKWKNLCQDYRMARALHAVGLRRRKPGIGLVAIQADWIESVWGSPCPVPIPDALMEPVEQEYQPVLRHAIRTLDRIQIAYAIGGSIASSLHGVGRMTRYADLSVEPFPGKEPLFIAAFPSDDYYLNPNSIGDALRNRSPFNILHPATGYKLDIYVRKDEPFEREAFSRRVSYSLPDSPNEPVLLLSPEDIVLFKLRWYRLGNEASEKQWSDILGVLRTQGDRLDEDHLDTWAAAIGVKDLLDKIRLEV